VIILAATPIGNLGDASRRLIEVLENAEIVAAEDTRTTQRLLQALKIDNRPRLSSPLSRRSRTSSSSAMPGCPP
jgi:16S rRNA (cytidine1402-2'-O)-methyltransferase